jgi:hypothetical protein
MKEEGGMDDRLANPSLQIGVGSFGANGPDVSDDLVSFRMCTGEAFY